MTDAVIQGVLQAIQEKKSPAEGEQTIADNFENYLKNPRLPSLPLESLLRILDKGMNKITADQNCILFVNAVPYHEYNAIKLIGKTNFHNVSNEVLMQMREISMGDGTSITLPIVRELLRAREEVEKFKDCQGPRVHTFTTKGVCTKCNNGKCPRPCDVPGCSYVHVYGDDGRCSVCGAPRCQYDGLHPFN